MHVLILDSNPTIRGALEVLFASEPDVTATACRELPLRSSLDHDVALVDERLAGAFTEHARAVLESRSRHAPVVVMGMGERASYEQAHVTAGAVGYWPKDGDVDSLVALVRAAGLVGQADRAYAAARRSLKARFAQRRTQRIAAAA
jgi:DNA-binding NarL/FixJ family response regulator